MRNRIFQHPSLLFTLIILGFLSLFPLITAYRYPPFLNDDSYITLTYAKNLANGNGFVFNHSPAVLGTTTPLFTIAIAGLALLFPRAEISVVAVFFTAFCWLGILWTFFFFRKAWGLENWQVWILAFIVAGTGWISLLGMEAYLFAFLLLLGISLFLSAHYWVTGFIMGLLFLTRGEGALALVVLLATMSIQHWGKRKSIDIELAQNILKLVGGFALPILFWAIYSHFVFGYFLPNTLAAKQAQSQTGLWRSFWQRLVNEWVPAWYKSFSFEGLPFVNFWWIIVFIGLIDALLRKHRWLIPAGWISLYISGYTLLNMPGYWWYQFPILLVLSLFFGLGIIKIVEMLIKHIKPYNVSLSVSTLLSMAIIFALVKPTFDFMLTYSGDARGESYTALSGWFREHADPTESIAFIEIGYLGYYTNNRIIDLAGLTLPDLVPHIAKKDFAWGFWQYEPDYYVYLPDFDWALASIKADPRFDRQYQPIATLHGPRETNFTIYKHVHQ